MVRVFSDFIFAHTYGKPNRGGGYVPFLSIAMCPAGGQLLITMRGDNNKLGESDTVMLSHEDALKLRDALIAGLAA